MRVLMVTGAVGFLGGAERYVHETARGMAALGHELWLAHGAGRGRDPERWAEPFSRSFAVGDPAALAGVTAAWVQRARDAQELSWLGSVPTAVSAHDHDLSCPRSHRYLPLTGAPCHAAPGLKCVAGGCVVVRDRRPERTLPVRVVDPFALRRATQALAGRAMLLACSGYVAHGLIAAGAPPSRVRVVHPLPPESPSPRVTLPDARRLLVVGSLLRGKGVDLAIDALRELPGDVTLDVVGDGPERAALEGRAASVAPGRVRFHGAVAPEAVEGHYDAARAVVVPARWPEPFGMTGLEAMRRGRPVVAAMHGGIPEWMPVGRGGEGFAPCDPTDLARAVRAVLADAGAGEAARRWAEVEFPYERGVAKAVAVLAGMASRRSAASVAM